MKNKMPWIARLAIFLVIFCPIMVIAGNLMGIKIIGNFAFAPFIFFMIIWLGASYHERYVVGELGAKDVDRR